MVEQHKLGLMVQLVVLVVEQLGIHQQVQEIKAILTEHQVLVMLEDHKMAPIKEVVEVEQVQLVAMHQQVDPEEQVELIQYLAQNFIMQVVEVVVNILLVLHQQVVQVLVVLERMEVMLLEQQQLIVVVVVVVILGMVHLMLLLGQQE